MLLVKTQLAPSMIHGVGLFAVEPIAAGTPVWRFVAGFDQRISVELALTWPTQAWATLEHYAGEENGEFWLDGDDARFINHSDTPNVVVIADELMVAGRAIAIGEEIVCDYRSFDDHCRTNPALLAEE